MSMDELESMRGFRRSQRHNQHKPSTADLLDEEEPRIALSMEGMLKKRLAKMPVMHDRYCVATWETDVRGRKCAILRSFKSRKAYDVHPERPTSIYEIKCISDWDGKTGFHRYKNAFTMETRDRKLFQCVAPSAADKNKWVELMASQSTVQSCRNMRVGNGGSLVPLRRSQSVVSEPYNGKPRAYSSASMGKTRHASTADADLSTDSEDQVNSSDQDGLFSTMSGASISLLEPPDGDKSEPADWGLYGETNDEIMSKYEVVDGAKPVLLESELLETRGKTKTLASDDFLFEEAGASRFGAVVVKGATGSDDDDDDDDEFIDEKFAAREAQKENEKKMKRRAQKLETNRDLYAEMAAARLASMRKDARHSKKSYNHCRLSAVSDDSETEEYDEDQSMALDSEEIVEMEDMNRRHSSQSHHSVKSQRKSIVSCSENIIRVDGGDASGNNEEAEDEEIEFADDAPVMETESDELRKLRKKYRAERRAKKRLLKEKEEEERTAMTAAELARAHCEEQRLREEGKIREEQEKRNKKERREVKEKLKQEKAKQRQAEAELQKLIELKQAEEERRERERKDRKDKKKSKKKEKYTSPAQRIHKKEERDAERMVESAVTAEGVNEVSNALVVVEKLSEPKAAKQPPRAPTVTIEPPSSSTQTEAVKSSQAAPSPYSDPPNATIPAPTSVPTTLGTAQAMPMYQVAPPPFVPTYPAGPQNMPAYGLAATFGAYPPFYTAPYSYGGIVGLQSLFPNMGFVAGLSALGSFGKPAGPDFSPTYQNSAEPIVGPRLPTPQERAAASSAGVSAHFVPSSPAACAKLINLPDLPDVVEF